MDSLQIGVFLLQDGVITGAIYALLGMALVLVFSVTRIIFFGQGEFVSFGALTLAMLQSGLVPGTVWLLVGMALLVGVLESVSALRENDWRRLPAIMGRYVLAPAAFAAFVMWIAPQDMPLLARIALTLAVVAPLGPLLYRLVYQPIAEASVLFLLIVSVGVHFVFMGLGLLFFGVEGFRTPNFWDGQVEFGMLSMGGQGVIVILLSALLIIGFSLVFSRSLYGKALRASASNATGAKLLGIPVTFAGKLAFTFASLIGALCGVLIAPIVTMYYDSGLLIGLKGFVAAIVGGLASYPLALAGAMGIGVLESVTSYAASAYKEAIVFLMVIPILLALSMRSGSHSEEH